VSRAAIVGAGFVARVHVRALRELGVPVVAVCGRTLEGAQAFGEGTPYDDLIELLERERPDVLHVCTPNHVHAEQALAALERGVHVVCEKPLAVSGDECARMVEAAERQGLVGATCYHVRGYPLVEQLRSEIAAGTLGEVTAAHGRYLCDDILSVASAWRIDPARSGPSYVVGDLGTHWLDAAEHVTGLRVAEVLAEFRSFSDSSLEDYAALLLRFEGGAVGSLLLSAGAAGRKNQLLLEVEGTRGGGTWDQEEPNTLLLRHASEPTRIVVKDPASNARSAQPLARYPAGHAEGYGGAFANVFRNVYAAVEGRSHEPFPTFEDGRRGIALLEAAVESARSGGWAPVVRPAPSTTK
jgi:predicted dehydrogenase